MIAQPKGRKLTYWSSGDVCAHYGVSRQTLKRWRADPAFPTPLKAFGGRGFLWDADEIKVWHRQRTSKHNGRKAGIISAHVNGNRSIRETARRHRIPPSTLRGWLIDTGHLAPPNGHVPEGGGTPFDALTGDET